MSTGLCLKCGKEFKNLGAHKQFCSGKIAGEAPAYPDIMTQCPNCKMVYKATVPDGKPHFLSGKHPKEAL